MIADIAAVAILAVLVLAGLGQARRATRLDRTRAKPPAGEARATGSQLPPPGPDRDAQLPVPGHRSPVTNRIHIHECGCVWSWNAETRRWARTVNCERLDEEIRRLTS